MKIIGQLERAQLENTTIGGLTGPVSTGRIIVDITAPTSAIPYFYNGTSWIQLASSSTQIKYFPTSQSFLSSSGTYVPSLIFTVVSANATIGATYTNNGVTFTVQATIAGGLSLWAIPMAAGTPSLSGFLTKTGGSGDASIVYTLVTNPLYLKATVVGAGGGGGGSGTAGSGGTGGTGVSSTFGTSLLTATGGIGGNDSAFGGTGGTGTISTSSTVLKLKLITGGSGSSCISAQYLGGIGGSNPLGGFGVMVATGAGGSGTTNTGSGGCGANGLAGSTNPAGGGGSGCYIEALIGSPLLTSYAFSVGAAGAAGTIGTSGATGGSGGSGLIIVEEFYQ